MKNSCSPSVSVKLTALQPILEQFCSKLSIRLIILIMPPGSGSRSNIEYELWSIKDNIKEVVEKIFGKNKTEMKIMNL